MKRTFICTVKCVGCLEKQVRVYDWLPEAPLCAKCKQIEAAHEGAGEHHEQED
jgi:hypothetical protein